MKLRDISNGPEWAIWVVFAIVAVLSVILLSGHGANLISGYNRLSMEEKAKYDEKKLCRVTGAGMLLIAVMILVVALCESILPAFAAYIILGLIIIDCVIVTVLGKTICKR